MKVNKALMFFCEAYFRPFPPQSDIRAFLLADIMKPKNRKLVYGVGTNNADYVVMKHETIGCVDGKQKQKTVWRCPYYQAWMDMLKRCYSKKHQEVYPTYKGCTVSAEWLTFSNFKTWMESQCWEGKHLDKDLLFEGNKIYSAETCVFVTPSVNTFANDCRASRGDCLIGVSWHKPAEKFRAQCRNPFTGKKEYLGLFSNEQQAHNTWLKRKLELAKELADIQTDQQVSKALIDRYSKLQISENDS